MFHNMSNLVFDANFLVDLRNKTAKVASDTLVKQVRDCLGEVVVDTGKKYEDIKYYIGKSTINEKDGKVFDPMEPTTWDTTSINSRWYTHKEKTYGQYGMRVIAAVPREAVPEQYRESISHEQYALALEQMLIFHWKLLWGDKRVANDTFSSGAGAANDPVAGAIYIAYFYNNGVN